MFCFLQIDTLVLQSLAKLVQGAVRLVTLFLQVTFFFHNRGFFFIQALPLAVFILNLALLLLDSSYVRVNGKGFLSDLLL